MSKQGHLPLIPPANRSKKLESGHDQQSRHEQTLADSPEFTLDKNHPFAQRSEKERGT